jgi:MFS family permease
MIVGRYLMPVYAHRFGLSGFQQGMVLGATGFACLAVSVPAGTLSDRFGARRITLAAGLLMAAATLAQAVAGGFPALLAARLAFGTGYGIVWTAGLCWLAGVADGPGALGGSVASAGVGGVAGPAAAGALTEHLGLAVPLLATAAGFAAITTALAGLRVAPGPAAPRPAAAGRRAAARDRGIIGAGAAAAVVTAGVSTGACALLVPAQLHVAGASAAQIGLGFAAAGILFAAGSALTAAVGRRAVNLGVLGGGIGRADRRSRHRRPRRRARSPHRDAVHHDRGPVRAVDGQLSPSRRRGGAARPRPRRRGRTA